jgi:hypothetical protein
VAHPLIVELMRQLPQPGTVWPNDRKVIFLQALDACIAHLYGGETHMIWVGEDGDIHISARKKEAPQVSAVSPSADEGRANGPLPADASSLPQQWPVAPHKEPE